MLLGRCHRAVLVFFIAVLLVLVVHQYIVFNRPSLSTFGLKDIDFNASIILLDHSLRPLACNTEEAISLTVNTDIVLSITSNGYRVYDVGLREELFKAIVKDGVVFAVSGNGSYRRLHFSPFLDIWPNKPLTMLQLIKLYQPHIGYAEDVLGVSLARLNPRYSWMYGSSRIDLNGKAIVVRDAATIDSRPLGVVSYNITRAGLSLSGSLELVLIDGSYKGSIPLVTEFLLPSSLVEKHYLDKLSAICGIDAGKIGYLRILLINKDKDLYSKNLKGWLFTLYPLLGALVSFALGEAICIGKEYSARRHGL